MQVDPGVVTRICKLSLIAVILVGSDAVLSATNEEDADQREQVSEQKLKEELVATATELLAILDDGDPKDLIQLVSREGVVLDVDADPTPLSEIRKDIEQKGYIYCLFFDTKCLQKKDAAWHEEMGFSEREEPLILFREDLRRYPKRKLNVHLWTYKGGWVGQVNVRLDEKSLQEGTQHYMVRTAIFFMKNVSGR